MRKVVNFHAFKGNVVNLLNGFVNDFNLNYINDIKIKWLCRKILQNFSRFKGKKELIIKPKKS